MANPNPKADWYPKFTKRLVDRLQRADWPDPTSEWWTDLRRELSEHNVSQAEADAAVGKLYASPPKWLSDVPAALLEAVRLVRDGQHAAGGSLDDARAAARDCPECGGFGLTSRFVRIARRDTIASVAFCCHRCAAGRWLADHYRQQSAGKTRIPNLASWSVYQDERLKYEFNEAYLDTSKLIPAGAY
jgi:hypothetical protein